MRYVNGDIYRCTKITSKGLGKIIESKIVKNQVPLIEVDNHEYLILGEEYGVIRDIPEYENDIFINPASIKYIDKPKRKSLGRCVK